MAVAFPHPARLEAHTGRAWQAPDGATLHRLADGTIVGLELLGPEHAERLRAGFERLSPISRYRRFFTAMPRMSEDMLRRLVATDGWNHVAIGAVTVPGFGGEPREAGVVRFHRIRGRTDAAEVAITVVDDFQGRGLGRLLLAEIARAAHERGIATLVANVLPANEPMIRLLHRMDPGATSRFEDGLYVFEVALDPAARRPRAAAARAA